MTSCPRCGSRSLAQHYDEDDRRWGAKCLACGHNLTKEQMRAMTESNGATKSKWNPSTKTLEEAEAEQKPTTRVAEPQPARAQTSAEILLAYNGAARRLLDAAEAHKAAIAAERKAIEEARATVERATSDLIAARNAHVAARQKLDEALGAIGTATEKPAEPKPEPKAVTANPPSDRPIGICRTCGQSKPLNRRGKCAKCWGDRTRKTGEVAAAVEVPA